MTKSGGKSHPVAHPSLGEATRTFARIGLLSFGGPAGQIATMHRILVDEKRWMDEAHFLHALNFCMLLPGPEATQLATYAGWLLHGRLGGFIAGMLFILPGIAAILVLSILYALLGQVGPVAALFFGLKAAVIAIVFEALAKVARRALKTRAARGLAAAAFVALFLFAVPFPLVVLAAGLIGYLAGRQGSKAFAAAPPTSERALQLNARARPTTAEAVRTGLVWGAFWLVPVAVLLAVLGPGHVMSQIAVFFSKMAVVTFGGAYAVLAYVAQQAVETYGWLSAGEMLDGLGMAETTPGPLIMVLQFVGFLAAFRTPGALPPLLSGALGGLLTTWVTFAPCFLWIFLGAPYVERLRGNAALASALAAITAAVVGVILNLAVWFTIHALFREVRPWRAGPLSLDLPVPASLHPALALLAAAALVAIFRFKLGMVPVLAACAAAGVALHLNGLV